METVKDLEINNILDLQIALTEDNNSAIKGYLIVERDYGVFAKMLALAGSIVQHLQFIVDDKIILYGLTVFKKGDGFAIEGREDQFYNTFYEVNKRHHLHRFFWNLNNLDRQLLRGADTIKMLGWRRCVLPGRNGYSCYRYEQCR